MKKLFVVLACLFLLANVAMSQVWVYDSDLAVAPQPHGLVVGNDGKIWIGYYGASDSLLTPAGTMMKINALRCYNPDGTQATFSPIKIFTNGADINDTLNYALPLSCRGLGKDQNGNILYSGSKGQLYRVNAQTGECMNRLFTPKLASLTNAAVDANGYIYLGHVGSGNQCYIFDTDFNLYSYVADTCKGLQRSLCVTPDGKDVYLGEIYSGNNGITHYHSDDGPDGTYTLVDTLLYSADHILWAQTIDWDNQGLMWVGTYWDVRVGVDYDGWYALDPTQSWAIIDTLGHNMASGGVGDVAGLPAYHSPRHVGFSPDGKIAYTNDFDGGMVKKWTNASPVGKGSTPLNIWVGVENRDGNRIIAVDFSLSQNYPNPFNPTTTIPFSLNKNSMVELKIFDAMGKEVTTLISQPMNVGNHDVTFNANGLASGMYYYRLSVDGKVITKSMLLIK